MLPVRPRARDDWPHHCLILVHPGPLAPYPPNARPAVTATGINNLELVEMTTIFEFVWDHPTTPHGFFRKAAKDFAGFLQNYINTPTTLDLLTPLPAGDTYPTLYTAGKAPKLQTPWTETTNWKKNLKTSKKTKHNRLKTLRLNTSLLRQKVYTLVLVANWYCFTSSLHRRATWLGMSRERQALVGQLLGKSLANLLMLIYGQFLSMLVTVDHCTKWIFSPSD
jgi:hypothetical protein